MSLLSTNPFSITEPSYYHREFANDITQQMGTDSWIDTCKRVGQVALPFISLCKPLSLPISLGMGGMRAYTCAAQLYQSLQQGDTQQIAYQAVQTTIAIVSLAGTLFAHPIGMLISTGHDLIIEIEQLVHHLQTGEYEKAIVSCLNILNNGLYLAMFLNGGLELAIVSLVLQILVGLSHSISEFKNGKYLEGSGHILMAVVRGGQVAEQAKLLKMKWKIEELKQSTKEKTKSANSVGTNARKPAKTLLTQNKHAMIVAHQSVNGPIKTNATKEGDIADILLQYGGDPSLVIFQAAKHGDTASVKKLLDYGACPVKNEYYNIVDSACEGTSVELLKYLMEEKGFIPVCKDPLSMFIHRQTPFLDGIDYLLSKGYTFSEDALFLSIYRGKLPSVETVKSLVSRGVRVSCLSDPKFSENSRNMLNLLFCGPYISSLNQQISQEIAVNQDLLDLFLSYGIDVNKKISFIKSDKKYPIGKDNNAFGIYNTPLLIAIANHNTELVKKLISNGANVNFEAQESILYAETPYNNNYHTGSLPITSLKLAMKYHYKDLILLLLENGAKI